MSEWLASPLRSEAPYLLAAALLLAAILWAALPGGRGGVRNQVLLLGVLLLADGLARALARAEPGIGRGLREAALLGMGIVLIRLAGLTLFRLALPRLRVNSPRIVEDIVVIGGYLLWAMVRLSYAGVELSSLVATSAVITAVLAFAMQDTLGNILGGLALQLDNSLEIGDWVRLDDVSGRVVEIQWRYTAILTRNGEKVVVPNAQLMKGRFSVIGDASVGVAGWRRWIGFGIDYAVSPSQVIAAAERTVAEAEIANVARHPPPSCVAMDFGPGAVRYALRYWLVDPRDDDATDSAVRMHLLASVQREGWRIALPDQQVHLVQDSDSHRDAMWRRELGQRVAVLAGIELFASLDAAERERVAARLVPAPFARGDIVTRQGAEAHWLYVIDRGQAEVYWEAPDGARELVAHLSAGQVFGEMSLMTGAPRSATVVAASDLHCYRLDKAGFADILRERPELAEGMSRTLAERQRQNQATKVEHDQRQRADEGAEHHTAILARIRGFFGLD